MKVDECKVKVSGNKPELLEPKPSLLSKLQYPILYIFFQYKDVTMVTF